MLISLSARRGRARNSAALGFTLIEVLVVVAIIALLLAILLPSLAAARNQAKLVVCSVNMKQIATFMSLYQADFAGFVPVMLNDAAMNGGINAPARTCWVSVALSRYSSQTQRMGTRIIGGTSYDFSAEAPWNLATRNAYEKYIMPEVYACPFQRGDASVDRHEPSGKFMIWHKEGRRDSIQTWLSENVVSGQLPPFGLKWPEATNGRDGLPKYTVFSWNRLRTTGTFKDGKDIPPISNAQTWNNPKLFTSYRRWTDADVRRMCSGSFSTTTVAYCAQGENILGDQEDGYVGRVNPGSHKSGAAGGTQAIFADTHVEWVPGKQIGWP